MDVWLIQETSIPRFEKNFLEVTYLPLHHFYINTQICLKESYEKVNNPYMANYTPSLITFSPPLTNFAEKPKEKEPGNEKKDEKNAVERRSLKVST